MDVDNAQQVTVHLNGVKATKAIGEILTSAQLTDYNSFEQPDVVKPAPFRDAKVKNGILTIQLPAKSIVTLELQ